MKELKNPFSTKEIVENLGIGDSTLRKWALALEEQNYNFMRTTQNKRLFSEKDLFVLSQFKILVQDKNLSIANAAAVIAAKYSNDVLFENETEVEQVLVPYKTDPFVYETLEELKTEMEQLKDLNRKLLSKLDEQQKYMEEQQQYIVDRLDKREELIKKEIKESQETKKLLLEVQEEKKKRKGIMSWFIKD